jgi:hypothetical protein
MEINERTQRILDLLIHTTKCPGGFGKLYISGIDCALLLEYIEQLKSKTKKAKQVKRKK